MENKQFHLQMIQTIISRMAGNSFFIKGWSVTLASAIFVLSAAHANVNLVYIAFFPVLAFWMLDGYFLRQERLFRKLYDVVRIRHEKDIDFSMDTKDLPNIASWKRTCVSPTLRLFHGSIVVLILVAVVIMYHKHI